jgi:hypothetical protein
MLHRVSTSLGLIVLVATATWLALALLVYLLLPRTIETIYQHQVRTIVQHDCGRPLRDVLLYTLTPGECRFANPEFDTRLVVDSDGFRNAPEHAGAGPVRIAVTGDSHALGWGVEQHETLAALLARDPRFTVRDLSMSSYGTPRELIAVQRHAPAADVVVLQYSDNDRAENTAFLADPVAFFSGAEARSEAYWTSLRLQMSANPPTSLRRTSLVPAFQALAATYDLLHLPPRQTSSVPPRILGEEARLFAAVLAHFRTDLTGKTVIVYESHPRRPRPAFAKTFQAALQAQGLDHIRVLDLTGTIGPHDYFHIDEHMRASGHAKIARRILTELSTLGFAPRP